MELLIIRHAIAEERTADQPDAARALTRKGRRKFRKVVRGLDALGVELGTVLHSPWRRAAETAALLRPLIAGDAGAALQATDALCATPAAPLVELIAGTDGPLPVAVVGHEPWLGELVALLVAGDVARGGRFPLKKGGVVRLTGTPRAGAMELRAALPPAVLRALA
jgi:phosphohistidine phosphatase